MTGLELAATAGRALHLTALAVLMGGAMAPFLGSRDLERVGLPWRRVGTGGLIVALAVVLATQAVGFRDPFEPFAPQLQGLLLRTDWGRTFLVQALLAGALLLPGLVRRPRLFAPVAAASAAMLAFSGHSWAVEQGRSWTVAAEIVHAVAASVWLGGLGVLVAAARRGRRSGPPGAGPERGLVGPASRFSATALVAVPLILLTGGVASWVHGGGLGALGEPGWGRAMAVKLTLVAAMLALGLVNWRRTLPALRAGRPGHSFASGPPLWEAWVGAAVLVVTAVLVGLSPPLPA